MTRLKTMMRYLLPALPVLGLGGCIYISTTKNQPVAGGIILLCTAAFTFGVLIYRHFERVHKGMCLVGLAVITAFISELCITGRINRIADDPQSWSSLWCVGGDLTVAMWSSFYSTGLSFINLACAGAGGSIIAVEADRSSIELPLPGHTGMEPNLPQSGPHTDYQALLQSLSQKVDSQTVAINTLEGALLSLCKQQRNLKWTLVTFAAVTVLLLVFILLTAQL